MSLENNQAVPRRSFWRIVGLTLLVVLATLLLVVVVAYAAGTVDVSVREKKPDGTRIHLMVPAVLISGGLRFVPGDQLSKASVDLRPWLPAIKAASRELARCPETILVDVQDRNDRVIVAKRGNSIVVDVDSEEDTVHVSVPLRFVAAIAQQLETSGPAN
jgi:hypothetical protein